MGDSVIGFLAGATFAMVCMLWSQIAVLRKRIVRVEGKLDVLLRNSSLHYDPFSDIPNDDVSLALASRRAEAQTDVKGSRCRGRLAGLLSEYV